MITTPGFHSLETTDNILASEMLYQQALLNDEQFYVLKDIRQAIKKLKKSIESKTELSVERIIKG